MAAAGHAIKEVVGLHRCGCGESYEQWGSRPTPPCPTCEKICFKKTAPDEKETERTERAGKRTKYEESEDKGKKIENTLPHQTKETRQSPTPLVFLDPTPGHDSMPRGHRRSEPNAHFNEEVYKNTRQTSGLRQGTSRTGDSIYACPPHSTDCQSHSILERGAS